MRAVVSDDSNTAMSRRRPPQRGHARTSSANTRRIRSAQRQPRLGLDTEPADGDSGIALVAEPGACGTISSATTPAARGRHGRAADSREGAG